MSRAPKSCVTVIPRHRDTGEFPDGEFSRIADIDRARHVWRSVHHSKHPLDQVGDVTETARPAAVTRGSSTLEMSDQTSTATPAKPGVSPLRRYRRPLDYRRRPSALDACVPVIVGLVLPVSAVSASYS